MGLNYGAQLAFPRSRAGDVLRDLEACADPVGESRIRLPEEEIGVPFTHDFRDAEVALVEDAWTGFEAAFWFPLDDIGRRFAEADRADGGDLPIRQRDGRDEIRVGYVYLTVGLGARYALFTLTAATSAMSRWFAESDAVRSWFAGFVERNGGLRGLLDLEWVHFPLLTEPGAYIVLDEAVLQHAGPDAWVEAALAAPVQHG